MGDSKSHDDILIDLPDESLDILADTYRRFSNIPYASTLLRNGKRLRKKGIFYITFMSAGDSWKEGGTFFALMQFPGRYQLALFTLAEDGEKVYKSLKETKRINFNRKVVFYAIHSSLYPIILRIIEEMNLKIEKTNPNYIYTMPKEYAIDFKIECPPDVKLAKLEITHSNLVNTHWTNSFPNSEVYVAEFIKNNGGFGLFLKSTNELVAWVFKTAVGKIGLLHTLETHRKKGYASILIKELSKNIALDGEDVTTNVIVTNEASKKLMEKLGFRNVGLCYYITLEENDKDIQV
ncbi:hypothetical protein JTB14_022925 [Gonioctena quinquepunctata]|nr:hypothetical protein JTB14_022925 [Gonioctena quinquepunctata]